jgi:flagellar basal body-associated protein FliL
MAKEQKTVEPLSNNSAAVEQPKSIFASRLVVILILVVLALAQTIIMYMLLPDPKMLAESISKQIPSLPEDLLTSGLSPAPTVHIDTRNWIEKKLGEPFKFQGKNKNDPTVYDQVVLTITVRINRKDESRYDRVAAARPEKLRDIVYTVLREANEDEFNTDRMISLKQKIMMQLNQELGEPFVKEVLFTDMSFSTS